MKQYNFSREQLKNDLNIVIQAGQQYCFVISNGEVGNRTFKIKTLDRYGNPLAGVTIVLSDNGETLKNITDGDGFLQFENVVSESPSIEVAEVSQLRKILFDQLSQYSGTDLPPQPEGTILPVSKNMEDVQLKSGQINQLIFVPAVVQIRLVGMFFDNAKCFLLPRAMNGIRKVIDVYDTFPDANILVVGHTDTKHTDTAAKSGEQFNRELSLERADSVRDYLTDQVENWYLWYSAYYPKNWGTPEDTYMLRALGYFKKGQTLKTAITLYQQDKNLQKTTTINKETRKSLIKEYMAIDKTSLPVSTTVITHGCGPYFPDKASGPNESVPENRRVEIFIFDGPIMPPPPGEYSDANSPEYPVWKNQVSDTIDFTDWTEEKWAEDHPGMIYDVKTGESSDGKPGSPGSEPDDPFQNHMFGGEFVLWNYLVNEVEPRTEHESALAVITSEWREKIAARPFLRIHLEGDRSIAESDGVDKARAEKIMEKLVDAGVDASLIDLGSEPIEHYADETENEPRSAENSARNRRIEAYLHPVVTVGSDASADDYANCTAIAFTNTPVDVNVTDDGKKVILTPNPSPASGDNKWVAMHATADFAQKKAGVIYAWSQFLMNSEWMGEYIPNQGNSSSIKKMDFSYKKYLPTRDWGFASLGFVFENEINQSGKAGRIEQLPGNDIRYRLLDEFVPDSSSGYRIMMNDKPAATFPKIYTDPLNPDLTMSLVKLLWKMDFLVVLVGAEETGSSIVYHPMYHNTWNIDVTATPDTNGNWVRNSAGSIGYGSTWETGLPSSVSSIQLEEMIGKPTARFMSRRRELETAVELEGKPARPFLM